MNKNEQNMHFCGTVVTICSSKLAETKILEVGQFIGWLTRLGLSLSHFTQLFLSHSPLYIVVPGQWRATSICLSRPRPPSSKPLGWTTGQWLAVTGHCCDRSVIDDDDQLALPWTIKQSVKQAERQHQQPRQLRPHSHLIFVSLIYQGK